MREVEESCNQRVPWVMGAWCISSFLSNVCSNRGSRGLGGPSGVSQARVEARGGGGEAETGELQPVSLGRGPGECSMYRGLVGPPSLPMLHVS